MIDCLTFGIILDDIVTWRGEVQLGVLGGGGAQTAWGMAAALGDGEKVGLSANVGDDLDSATLAPLESAGIDLSGILYNELPTPRAWQVMEADGQRTEVWRVPKEVRAAQLRRDWRRLPDTYADARAIHYGIHPEAADLEAARYFHAQGAVVSLEAFRAPAHPLSDAQLTALLGACHIFSANDAEAAKMVGDSESDAIAARFAACGGRILILRQGARGSLIYDLPKHERIAIPSVTTHIVDVTGAGNAYCGAFVAALSEGHQRAGCHAAVAASYMVEQFGLPTRLPDPTDYQARFGHVLAESQVING
jgi:cytidine kinase